MTIIIYRYTVQFEINRNISNSVFTCILGYKLLPQPMTTKLHCNIIIVCWKHWLFYVSIIVETFCSFQMLIDLDTYQRVMYCPKSQIFMASTGRWTLFDMIINCYVYSISCLISVVISTLASSQCIPGSLHWLRSVWDGTVVPKSDMWVFSGYVPHEWLHNYTLSTRVLNIIILFRKCCKVNNIYTVDYSNINNEERCKNTKVNHSFFKNRIRPNSKYI